MPSEDTYHNYKKNKTAYYMPAYCCLSAGNKSKEIVNSGHQRIDLY